MRRTLRAAVLVLLAASVAGCRPGSRVDLEILNVSYDPTRELYREVNRAFAAYWKSRTGLSVRVRQSHGGSGKQARAVIDGLAAQVVTLAVEYDVNALQKAGLIPPNWKARLPHASTPFTSTVVFLVRKGNPRQIRDWADLTRPGLQVITPNPKTSGGARLNYLGAWAYALEHHRNDAGKARELMARLYRNVPVLDSGARGSTTTFIERGIGDVLVTWENEALTALRDGGRERLEIVTPSFSVRAEPPVALVDRRIKDRRTEEAAQAYLQFLFTPRAQEIAARHFYRPTDPIIARRYAKQFPELRLIGVDALGGWEALHEEHFREGGVFDLIYTPGGARAGVRSR